MKQFSRVDCASNNDNHTSNINLFAEEHLSSKTGKVRPAITTTENILSRMDRLRAYANEQQAKHGNPKRVQTSFCF
jgi:hypothetical protein